MRDRRPFPLVGGIAAAIAAGGIFRDEPVIALLLAVLFTLIGLIGAIVYARRRSRQ